MHQLFLDLIKKRLQSNMSISIFAQRCREEEREVWGPFFFLIVNGKLIKYLSLTDWWNVIVTNVKENIAKADKHVFCNIFIKT